MTLMRFLAHLLLLLLLSSWVVFWLIFPTQVLWL